MSNSDFKTLIQQAFEHTLVNPRFGEETIMHFFSPDYVQHVDGKTIHLPEFVTHVKALKEATLSITVTFDTLIQEGNTVFSNHRVVAQMRDGRINKAHVMAEFRIANGKISYCDELTHVVGNDKDLGSRY